MALVVRAACQLLAIYCIIVVFLCLSNDAVEFVEEKLGDKWPVKDIDLEVQAPVWLNQEWTDAWSNGETSQLLYMLYNIRFKGNESGVAGMQSNPKWLAPKYLPDWANDNKDFIKKMDNDLSKKINRLIQMDPLHAIYEEHKNDQCCPDWLSGYGIEVWKQNNVLAITTMLSDLTNLINYVSGCFNQPPQPKTYPVWLMITHKHVWTKPEENVNALRDILDTVIDKLAMILPPAGTLPQLPVGDNCTIQYVPEWMTPAAQRFWRMESNNLAFLHSVYEDLDRKVLSHSGSTAAPVYLAFPKWMNPQYVNLWRETSVGDFVSFIIMRAEVAMKLKLAFIHAYKLYD